MQKISRHEISEKLIGIINSMKADSYKLDVVGVEGKFLHLQIDALDGACEDCLVPAKMMTVIISSALDGLYSPEQINIDYPTNIDSH